MRVCGIIAEYDPFHLGHAFQLNQARARSGADFVVCVISSAFTQRGYPALFSTHDRARMALAAGADLVLGLPVSWSCAQANRFALGGVGTLLSLGMVTHLSFGVESEALPLLQQAAELLHEDGDTLAAHRKQALAEGKSFARAQGEALKALMPGAEAEQLLQPNFVLGLSYLQALHQLHGQLDIVPVPRQGSYHSKALSPGNLPSATAVRTALLQGDWESVAHSVPDTSLQIMREATRHLPGALDKALLAKLLSGGDYSDTADISEGLENRILAMAPKAANREELIQLVKSKRYPFTRINRALTGMLLGLPAKVPPRPTAARLLGFRQSAKPLLQAIKQAGFPLVDRPAQSSDPHIARTMQSEELWHLGAGQPARKAFQQQVIILP